MQDTTGTYSTTYDSLNRPLTVTNPDDKTLTMTYSPPGRRITLVDPDSGTTTFGYDTAGRPTLTVNPQDERTTSVYDAAGRETQQKLDNGTWTSMTYDAAGRTTRQVNYKSDNSVISSFDYTYDSTGNKLNVVEADGDRVSWTYDNTYQLLTEHRSGADSFQTTFTYDPTGNRLTEDDATTVTTSVYDVANRLTSSETPSGRTTYTFDENGNQRSIETPSVEITTYAWDYENQMAQIEEPLGDVVTYAYNPEQQRVKKETDVETTVFLWDDENILQEYDEVGLTEADYTYQPAPFGNLLSQHRDTESSFYHYDQLGSTNALTDSAEVVDNTYTYHAFGQIKASSGTVENPFTWVGQIGYYRDEESSLYSLRRRPYDPANGRFTSEDPITEDEENLYRYVGNDAVNEVDPSGLEAAGSVQSEVDRLQSLISRNQKRLDNLRERLNRQRNRTTNTIQNEIRVIERRLRGLNAQLLPLLQELQRQQWLRRLPAVAQKPPPTSPTIPVSDPCPPAAQAPTPQPLKPGSCGIDSPCVETRVVGGDCVIFVRKPATVTESIVGWIFGEGAPCGATIATIYYPCGKPAEKDIACQIARKLLLTQQLGVLSVGLGKAIIAAGIAVDIVTPAGEVIALAEFLGKPNKQTAMALGLTIIVGAAIFRGRRGRGKGQGKNASGSGMPNSSRLWGKNRLIKELNDRGFVYVGRTRSDGGFMYRHAMTGEEVRIMPRPNRRPFKDEPPAKFESQWYYRYRSGLDQPWGSHTSLPDP